MSLQEPTFNGRDQLNQDVLRAVAGNSLVSYQLALTALEANVIHQQQTEFGQFMGQVVRGLCDLVYYRDSHYPQNIRDHYEWEGKKQKRLQLQEVRGTFNKLEVVDLGEAIYPVPIYSAERLATCASLRVVGPTPFLRPHEETDVLLPLFRKPMIILDTPPVAEGVLPEATSVLAAAQTE